MTTVLVHYLCIVNPICLPSNAVRTIDRTVINKILFVFVREKVWMVIVSMSDVNCNANIGKTVSTNEKQNMVQDSRSIFLSVRLDIVQGVV